MIVRIFLLFGLLLAGLIIAGCAGDGSELVDDMMGGMVCGDGTVDLDEECDDGNTASGDGCTADCTSELATLAWIQTNVFSAVCVQCHFPGGPGPMPLDSEQASFDNLVNVPSIEVALLRVEPGNSEDSYLQHKIEGRATIAGTRMPPPPRPSLTAEQVEAIRLWIDNGAPR